MMLWMPIPTLVDAKVCAACRKDDVLVAVLSSRKDGEKNRSN